jgi:hypothetical protein
VRGNEEVSLKIQRNSRSETLRSFSAIYKVSWYYAHERKFTSLNCPSNGGHSPFQLGRGAEGLSIRMVE